jgi:hypothetical protein
LSHTAGQIPCIYDRANDVYRPIEKSDLSSFANSEGSTNFDSFGRMRVSNPLTLFDSSHRFADNGLWSTSTATGGTATFNATQGLVDLDVTAASGSQVIRETTKVFSYQPGKSLLNLNTFVMSPAKTGLRQRVGYYGAANGYYLELNDSTVSFVERSSVSGSLVNTPVAQANWNVDPLNGLGGVSNPVGFLSAPTPSTIE